MKAIYIYNGDGAGIYTSSYCLLFAQQMASMAYLVKFISAQEVKEGKWRDDAALFIMPGGATVPYNKALEPEGNKNLRDFVSEGGKYLGICAGAYYGCNRTLFAQGHSTDELEISEPLKFFPGTAIGPAYGPLEYDYESQKGSHASLVNWVDSTDQGPAEIKPFFSYFNGGCRFDIKSEPPPNVKILARYGDIAENPPAIIECAVGDRGGKAILTGVHLENPAMHSEYQPIRDQIDQTTLVREYVLSRLLQRLGVQLNSRYEASALAQSQPASSTNNFIAIYKVELKPQQVGQYEQCWKQISDYLINRRGALCSIIAEPENTMGADDRQLRTIISFWPSKEARDQAWPKDKTKIDKEIQAASEQMTTCRFPDSEVIQEGATIHRTNIPEQLSSQIQAIISLETGHHYTSNMQPAFFQQKPTEGGRGPDSHLKITDPVIDSTMRHESAARPRPPQ